ncbi:hypothetical protein VNI00_014430 [Paramarasmius palmivorus]|uniref:Uncharacterized protein n=1 Tax=Paramarasmius palmivorus TaxID=297713 RepID=A0AAW0BSE5_9AGAR
MTSVSRSDVMVIVDDTNSMFKFDGSRWSADSVSSRWYRNTSMHASKASVASGRPASFNLSFYGTSVAITGGSRIENHPTFSVSIDSQQLSSLAYSEMAIDTRWYTSQTLPDQLHQLTVSGLDRVVVDYAIITPGDSTPLLGSTIAVDDSSPEIMYHGNWKEETGRLLNTTSALFVRPLRNTTHTSSTVGDYFIFQFAVNVTDLLGDQSFIIDHLTYTASFSRLSEKPDFPVSSGFDHPESTKSTASSTPSGQSQLDNVQSSKERAGVIAGGVVAQDLMAKPFPRGSTAARSESLHQDLRLPNTPVPQGYSHPKPLYPGASKFPLDSTHDTTVASPTSGTSSTVCQMEVQQRLDQITLLESRIEEAQSTRHSSVDVDALYAEIDRLRRDNERLERGYQPPPSYAKAIESPESETYKL